MQERSFMVCASSKEKKELHWLKEALGSRGSGKKKIICPLLTANPTKIDRTLETTLPILNLQCVKTQH